MLIHGMYMRLGNVYEPESLDNLFYIYVCFDWNNTLNDVINLDGIIFDIFILKNHEGILNPFV